MIKIIRNQKDFLKISIDDLQNRFIRFPNQMIWDINTYLSERYEYYFSKNVCDKYCVSLPSLSVKRKYLCFADLDPSYIKLVNFDEEEYQAEYEKHQSEVDSYEQFVEYYAMEEISELSYIATVDMLHYSIKKKLLQNLLTVFQM